MVYPSLSVSVPVVLTVTLTDPGNPGCVESPLQLARIAARIVIHPRHRRREKSGKAIMGSSVVVGLYACGSLLLKRR
jgi:hypothetical protein